MMMFMNFDETDFQIGVMAGKKAIVPTETHSDYSAYPENRKSEISAETLNYGGRKMPPLMMIFTDAYVILRQIFRQ